MRRTQEILDLVQLARSFRETFSLLKVLAVTPRVWKPVLCRSVMTWSSQDNMTCVFYTVKFFLDCNSEIRAKHSYLVFHRSVAFSDLLDQGGSLMTLRSANVVFDSVGINRFGSFQRQPTILLKSERWHKSLRNLIWCRWWSVVVFKATETAHVCPRMLLIVTEVTTPGTLVDTARKFQLRKKESFFRFFWRATGL